MIKYIIYKLLKKIQGNAIKNSDISKTAKIEAGSIVVNSKFGNYSFCGYDCKIINTEIGSFCSIADKVTIGVSEHPITWVSTSPVFYKGKDSVKIKFSEFKRPKDKKTTILHDVWIGENVMIKSGVTIETGAIIGMGSIVTHNVKPYEIVAGVPAKHIKYRFDNKTIKRLLDSKWWEFNSTELKRHAKYIREPNKFLEGIKK